MAAGTIPDFPNSSCVWAALPVLAAFPVAVAASLLPSALLPVLAFVSPEVALFAPHLS